MVDTAAINRNAELRAHVSHLEDKVKQMQRPLTTGDVEAMRETQARADRVAAQLGERVSEPKIGETPLEYRRRIAQQMAQHSPRYKGETFYGVGAAAMDVVEREVLNDAQHKAHNTARETPGRLFEEKFNDGSGRIITKYHGDPMPWMQNFCTGGQVGFIRRPKG